MAQEDVFDTVVFYEVEDTLFPKHWVAHSLEFDQMAWGDDIPMALQNLKIAVKNYVACIYPHVDDHRRAPQEIIDKSGPRLTGNASQLYGVANI